MGWVAHLILVPAPVPIVGNSKVSRLGQVKIHSFMVKSYAVGELWPMIQGTLSNPSNSHRVGLLSQTP